MGGRGFFWEVGDGTSGALPGSGMGWMAVRPVLSLLSCLVLPGWMMLEHGNWREDERERM